MGGTTGVYEALVPVYAVMRDWDERFKYARGATHLRLAAFFNKKTCR